MYLLIRTSCSDCCSLHKVRKLDAEFLENVFIYNLDPIVIYSFAVPIWNPELPEIHWFSQTSKKLHERMWLSISLIR